MKPHDEWHLETKHIGRRVLVFDQLDSTNNYLASLIDKPDHAGVVVLADEQTAGRGQPGRTWMCPPGDGVLMSVLIFPPPKLCRPPILTAWAAVSACETIHEVTGLQATIKWPNDVLIRGRKVCGILVEHRAGGKGDILLCPPSPGVRADMWDGGKKQNVPFSSVIVGIGLNVSQSAESLAAAGLTQAASLSQFVDGPLDRRHVTHRLIHQLDDEYDRLCRDDFAPLEACWKGRLGLEGKPVVVECLDRTIHGRLRDVTFDAVDVELADGGTVRVRPETIRHIRDLSPRGTD